MAVIAPFKGITYNFHKDLDFSRLVAPPYDVISESEQERYYRAHPYNVIRLILGKKKRGDSDWDNRYTRAAEYFRRWQSEGVLMRSDQPSIYLVSLTFSPEEGIRKLTRWGMIVVVRIEEQGSGVVLPHEQTFSAHKDDRLRLMRTCSAQFSQIFGLYEDADHNISNVLRETVDFSPQISFDFEDGTEHKMWILDNNRSLFKELAYIMRDKKIFIADGHHRYETSRNFKNIMMARYGSRPVNRSYEYVMMYLTNMYDEGLTVLPSHRLVKKAPYFELHSFLEKAGKWFDISEFHLSGRDPKSILQNFRYKLKEEGQRGTAVGFYPYLGDRCYLLSLKPNMRQESGDDLHPSLKKLDVLVLSRLIFQKTIGFEKKDMDNDEIFHYQSNMERAFSQVSSGDYHIVFFLNPTKVDHVKEVADHSLVMPRKSTYFYPKILTGLVFNKIDPHETIHIP